jgi:glycosyltransferase involved in cell wall biosynthesis
MRLHIAHVVHSFPPATFGGIESYVEDLTKEQLRRGCRVTILTGREPVREGGERFEPRPVEGSRLEIIDAAGAADVVGRHGGCGRVFSRVLRDLRPDVVHVHHWLNLTLNLVRRARSCDIPVVLSLHDFFTSCFLVHRVAPGAGFCEADLPFEACVACGVRQTGFSAFEVERVLRARNASLRAEVLAAHAVLALSRAQLLDLNRMKILQGARIRVLPVPRRVLEPVPDASPKPGGLRLMSWGGLVPGKGLHLLVEAAELLAGDMPVRVDHLGRIIDETYAASLRGTARRSELHLHGRYRNEDLRRVAADAHACVFPSGYRETHGYVVDEALSLGPPVVVSDHGAPPERLGARGLAFPPGDVTALAALLRGLGDPVRQAELRQGKPDLTPPMEWHAERLEETYGAIMRAENAGSR